MNLSATVEATTIKEIRLAPQLKKKLKTNLDAYADLKLQRDAIDHAMKKHKDTVENIMSDLGEASIKLDGYTSTVVSQVRKKLDQKKLLALGVSIEVIEQATVETPTKPYLKITTPNGSSSDDE